MFQNPVPEGIEPAGDDGDIVDREGGDDEPHDRPEGEDAAGDRGIQNDAGRDMPADDRDENADDQASQRRLPAWTAQDAEQHQHDEDRQRPDDKGQAKATADGRQKLVKHPLSCSLGTARRRPRRRS